MIYRGKVYGDAVKLPPGVRLPEGTEVLLEPIVAGHGKSPTSSGAPETVRNGVPVFPRRIGSVPDIELVNKLHEPS